MSRFNQTEHVLSSALYLFQLYLFQLYFKYIYFNVGNFHNCTFRKRASESSSVSKDKTLWPDENDILCLPNSNPKFICSIWDDKASLFIPQLQSVNFIFTHSSMLLYTSPILLCFPSLHIFRIPRLDRNQSEPSNSLPTKNWLEVGPGCWKRRQLTWQHQVCCRVHRSSDVIIRSSILRTTIDEQTDWWNNW